MQRHVSLVAPRNPQLPAAGGRDQHENDSCTKSGVGAVKMIIMSVANLYGSKGAGQAWIDEYIDKVTSALNSK
jgi:hypothetical protein